MNIRLVTALLTRDAMTRLPVTVPAHEVDILQFIFGEDSVQITSDNAGTVELDPASEGERLAGKYGEAAIAGLYGGNFKGAAARACSSHEATSKAKAKEVAAA